MTPTRATKANDLATIHDWKVRQEDLSAEQLVQERLANLQNFVARLAQTPEGKIDLCRRIQRYGECLRAAGECDRLYYGRLRTWLDRSLDR